MSIFRQSATIPTALSSVANITTGTLPVIGNKIVLNGLMASSLTGQVSFINSGYASGISISSTANISTATFTIVGTYNGATITETVTGPNATTVYTNNLFHTIISINATGPGVGAFTIGSNYNVAVMLIGDNPVAAKLPKTNGYNILLNSRTATGNWVAGTAVVYGLTGQLSVSLQASALVNTTTYSNYFALFGATAITTVAQLNTGVITQTTYPFAAVIVYLAAGINTTPVFVEITQS